MTDIKFEFSVGSDVDFEELVADIGFKNNLVSLITQEDGFNNMRIRIYPPKDKNYWDFNLNDFIDVIEQAKNRLWELKKTSSEDSLE